MHWCLIKILYKKGVKYVITVKIGSKSPKSFNGNLGINLVSKNLQTGFINLDENIFSKQKNKIIENCDKKELFKSGKKYKFEFDETDIRGVLYFKIEFNLK